MKNNLRTLSALFLLLLLFSCHKEDDTLSQEQAKVERSLFNCPSYETSELTGPGSSLYFDEMIRYGDYFLYGGFDDLLVTDGFNGEVVLEKNGLDVHKFLPYNQKMLICGTDGIYELDEELNFTQKSELGCWDIILSPDGKLLFAPLGQGSVQPQHIYELSPVDFTPTRYTSNYETGMCVSLDHLFFDTQGYLWAVDCSGHLLKFDGPNLAQRISAENSNFWGHEGSNPAEDETHFLNYKDGMAVVAKAGVLFYEILYYKNGEWAPLFLTGNTPGEELPEKAVEMLRGTVQDAVITGEKLLVATNRGVHEFNLSQSEELSLDDVVNITDPNLPAESAYDLYAEPNGDWYVISTQKAVTRIRCQ
ncbi:MAG: hypothetical protein KDD19_02615 [Phaeodactylibacter sp.]|nr:hypothetical protein [Phaeodactylibacter sp.]MCB9050663.1 hypothetical protein [Lewinellaceae bacterium]